MRISLCLSHIIFSQVQCIPFHESLYFIFVTISTVGYGDVNPETVLGQFLVVAFIILAGTLVPRQISKLARYAYLVVGWFFNTNIYVFFWRARTD